MDEKSSITESVAIQGNKILIGGMNLFVMEPTQM
jgi:hypothetical protein